MKYDVGDKITVRNDIQIGGIYANCEFVPEMNIFSGKVATITETLPDQDQYKIDVDGSKYFWHSNMFRLTFRQTLNKRFKAIKL